MEGLLCTFDANVQTTHNNKQQQQTLKKQQKRTIDGCLSISPWTVFLLSLMLIVLLLHIRFSFRNLWWFVCFVSSLFVCVFVCLLFVLCSLLFVYCLFKQPMRESVFGWLFVVCLFFWCFLGALFVIYCFLVFIIACVVDCLLLFFAVIWQFLVCLFLCQPPFKK